MSIGIMKYALHADAITELHTSKYINAGDDPANPANPALWTGLHFALCGNHCTINLFAGLVLPSWCVKKPFVFFCTLHILAFIANAKPLLRAWARKANAK